LSPEDPSCLLFQASKLCMFTVLCSHLGTAATMWRVLARIYIIITPTLQPII
jgi:hypothetical protein